MSDGENKEIIPNTRRKVFFGLFLFPMLIAVTMAVLLSAVVLLTHEEETPESLITAIKTSAPSKRWQKAFELSNELNREGGLIRSGGIMNEIIHIFNDSDPYDAKTRSYMAMALSRFKEPEAKDALVHALSGLETEDETELPIFLMWAIGNLNDADSAGDAARFLTSSQPDLRKTAAYILGVLGNKKFTPDLKRSLEDSVLDVRWNAALALARLGDESSFDILIQMLDRNYLRQAHPLNESDIERIMTNAAKALGLSHRAEAIQVLKTVSENDPNLKIKQAARAAMQQPSLRGRHQRRPDEAISKP